MRRMFKDYSIALCLTAVLCLMVGCSKEEPIQAVPTPPAQAGESPVVTGKVVLKGDPPPPRVLQMDATCGKLHAGPVTTRDYEVGEGGGLANVFVSIKGGLEGLQVEPPAATPLLDQEGCIYKPYVLGVITNQKFTVRNSDAVLHNVHAMPKKNKPFNFAQPIKGQETTRTFTEPEVFIRLMCNVHPWMDAYVAVIEHPFFAITDENGAFQLPDGLPPGTYTIEAIHPKAGAVSQEIKAEAGKPLAVDFELEVRK